MARKSVSEDAVVRVNPPRFERIQVRIRGTAPYMQHRFGEKAKNQMADKQKAGSQAKKGSKKEPRDFQRDFLEAGHVSTEGWYGIPAPAIRAACIDACRMTGEKMTFGKMSVFVEHDGYDAQDPTPLIRLDAGEPEMSTMSVRIAKGGTDLRVRPVWREWSASVRMRYDADQFSAADVVNLLARAGMQVGIGEGRPFSKNSCGMGYGTFVVETEA